MAVRTSSQRRTDTLDTLGRSGNVWVASANATGDSHLTPLGYSWDGERLTVATRKESKTGRNLARARRARVALASTEDVVILEGPLEVIPIDADDALADAHAASTGDDFRQLPEPYVLFRLTPERIQAMRSPEEEPGRTIMRNGRWLED